MRATIWCRTSCPYCVRAIDDLARRGFNIDIKYIGQNGITKQDLLSIMLLKRCLTENRNFF